MKVIIGTRGSRLALAQAEYVRDILQNADAGHTFEIKIISTTGDRVTDRPLDQIGGRGLFVREIEQQLLSGEIQLAVHSMKDMPAELPEGLVFASTWQREDPRDVLVLREKHSLSELPQGAVIGTGSIRRQALLHRLRPDLRLTGIRGNVDTRLCRMQEDKLDGIVLAAAGMHRLGRQRQITQYLSYEEMVPAPAQGALALEVRRDDYDLQQFLTRFADRESEFAVKAEREFMRLCGGGCHMPVGAICRRMPEGHFHMRTVFGDRNGGHLVLSEVLGTDPVVMAREAASMYGMCELPVAQGEEIDGTK